MEATILIPKFMQIEGTNQGKFGGSILYNHESSIELISFSHKLRQPLEPDTHQPSAKRVHDAIRVVKKIDKSSVKLYTALTKNEILKSAMIFLVDDDRPGIRGANFTISLGDSVISEINQIKSPVLDVASATGAHFLEYEEIALSYQKITWKFGDLSNSDALKIT